MSHVDTLINSMLASMLQMWRLVHLDVPPIPSTNHHTREHQSFQVDGAPTRMNKLSRSPCANKKSKWGTTQILQGDHLKGRNGELD